MISLALSHIAVLIAEQKAFNELCNSLPKDEADMLRKKRRKRLRKVQKQRNRIEIAKAGRSRNFWGNY